MADPVLTVAELLRPTFTQIAGGVDSDPVVRRSVRRSDRADAQVNGSLALAKVLGKTPREVAQMVLDSVDLSAVCSATEIAGPGFINVTFSNEFLASELVAAAADSRLGVRNAPAKLKVVVDYSAPNVAKEMHVRRQTLQKKCTLGTCAARSSVTH